jgi:pre-mRNA-splicing factor CDC5/CEF1
MEEMARLLLHDASRYPIPGTVAPKAPVNFVEYSTAEMSAARKEVAKSLSSQTTFPSDIWASYDSVNLDDTSSSSITETLTEFAPLRNKLEKKLTLTLGGYQARQGILSSKIKEVSEVIEQARIDLENYRTLQASERATVALRLNPLVEEVEMLERRERDEQRRFKELTEVRHELASSM